MSAITLEELMRLTFERNASDLLLTAGAPPQLRINGFLESIGTEPLEPETTRALAYSCLLYTSPSPRDGLLSRMPSSA